MTLSVTSLDRKFLSVRLPRTSSLSTRIWRVYSPREPSGVVGSFPLFYGPWWLSTFMVHRWPGIWAPTKRSTKQRQISGGLRCALKFSSMCGSVLCARGPNRSKTPASGGTPPNPPPNLRRSCFWILWGLLTALSAEILVFLLYWIVFRNLSGFTLLGGSHPRRWLTGEELFSSVWSAEHHSDWQCQGIPVKTDQRSVFSLGSEAY